MQLTRRHTLFASLLGASMIAACSSDKPTGPSSGSLARLFDSAFVADTPGGRIFDTRPQLEQLMAFLADEGTTPSPVTVMTDSGALSMEMMAFTIYDTTASGSASDSDALVVGWTSDYHRYVALLEDINTGNGPPADRIGVDPTRLAALTSVFRSARRSVHGQGSFDTGDAIGFVVDGDSSAQDDSAAGDLAWSARSGHCSWQHVIVPRLEADSTLACSPVTATLDFAFHFPPQAGVSTSLAHMTMSSTAVHGARIVGFN